MASGLKPGLVFLENNRCKCFDSKGMLPIKNATAVYITRQGADSAGGFACGLIGGPAHLLDLDRKLMIHNPTLPQLKKDCLCGEAALSTQISLHDRI
jgi:hypothetical protein